MLTTLQKRELATTPNRVLLTMYLDVLQRTALGYKHILLFKILNCPSLSKFNRIDKQCIIPKVTFVLAQLLRHEYISESDRQFYEYFYNKCGQDKNFSNKNGLELVTCLMDTLWVLSMESYIENLLINELYSLYLDFLILLM